MTTDFRALCVELVRITDAFNSGTPLLSNQGQALDGYSALAAFCDVAIRARAALSDLEPPSLKEQALKHVGVIQDNWTVLGNEADASPSLTGQIAYEQLDTIRRALEQLDD